MKVWILNHYAGTPDTTPAIRPYSYGKELVRRGHEVTIFASSFSHYSFEEEHLAPGESWKAEYYDGIRFIWVKTRPYFRNDWRRFANMVDYSLWALLIGVKSREKPDVIIGTCGHLLGVLAAYFLSLFKGSRFFYEPTDLWPESLIDLGAISEKGLVARGLRILSKFLCVKAEGIITNLPNLGDYVEAFGVSRDKVIYLPNGVDFSIYKGIKPYDGGAGKTFTIMYIGGFAKAHGLEYTIEAARILKDEGFDGIRFVLVGDGPEKSKLEKICNEMGLENVEFWGWVPKAKLPKVMEKADAFSCSSLDMPVHRFGMGFNKLYDYLVAGRPIIYSVNSKNRPVDEARAGISIPAESAESLAVAVKMLVSMTPEQRREMGNNGFIYVKKNHDFEILGGKLESALQQSLS